MGSGKRNQNECFNEQSKLSKIKRVHRIDEHIYE